MLSAVAGAGGGTSDRAGEVADGAHSCMNLVMAAHRQGQVAGMYWVRRWYAVVADTAVVGAVAAGVAAGETGESVETNPLRP